MRSNAREILPLLNIIISSPMRSASSPTAAQRRITSNSPRDFQLAPQLRVIVDKAIIAAKLVNVASDVHMAVFSHLVEFARAEPRYALQPIGGLCCCETGLRQPEFET